MWLSFCPSVSPSVCPSITKFFCVITHEISTFPIVVIFFRGCVPEMFVALCSVTYCIYVPGKPGICFHYYCAVYDECKYSDTFWLTDRTRFLCSTTSHYHPCANLSEGIEVIKWLSDIFCRVCKIKHILCVIQYTIYGAVCFQFTHLPCDDWDNIYALPYYHHRIGSIDYYPLFRVRSWNNGIRCISFYTLLTRLS